jgi:hypothetical protein
MHRPASERPPIPSWLIIERQQARERDQRMARELAELRALVVRTKVRPGLKESPLALIAIEAAKSLKAAGKPVTATTVRRRMEKDGNIVPHTNRMIQNWIKPVRK